MNNITIDIPREINGIISDYLYTDDITKIFEEETNGSDNASKDTIESLKKDYIINTINKIKIFMSNNKQLITEDKLIDLHTFNFRLAKTYDKKLLKESNEIISDFRKTFLASVDDVTQIKMLGNIFDKLGLAQSFQTFIGDFKTFDPSKFDISQRKEYVTKFVEGCADSLPVLCSHESIKQVLLNDLDKRRDLLGTDPTLDEATAFAEIDNQHRIRQALLRRE